MRAVLGRRPFLLQGVGAFWRSRKCATVALRFCGYIDRPAQAPDGTIYALEHIGGARNFPPDSAFSDYGNNKSVVILDGTTGQVLSRVPLPREYSQSPCGPWEGEPRTLGPIVNSDGYAYLLVHKHAYVATGTCNTPITTMREVGWTLLRLTRNGVTESIVVDQSDALTPKQLLPDGLGGLLIRGQVWLGNQTEGRLIRFDSERQRTEHTISLAARIDLIGQGGIIYLQSRTENDDYYGVTEALNIATFTSLWTKSPGWNLTAAKPDGGGTALDSGGQLLDINSNGQLSSATTFGLTRPVQVGSSVIGQGTTTPELKAIVFDAPDATRYYAPLMRVSFATSRTERFRGPGWRISGAQSRHWHLRQDSGGRLRPHSAAFLSLRVSSCHCVGRSPQDRHTCHRKPEPLREYG